MARKTHIPLLSSLRFKVGFGYIVLVIINTVVSVWTIYNVGRLTDALDVILGTNYQNVVALENMARAIERHEHALASILNNDLNNGKIEFTQAKDDFFQSFTHADQHHTVADAEPILENIYSTYQGYLLLTDSLMKYVEKDNFTEAKAFHYNTLTPFYQRLVDNCFWLIEENQNDMLALNKETKGVAQDTVVAVLSASMLALVLSILTMVQFTKKIIEPAERLTDTVHQIGRGRLDLKTDVQTNDEIGVLSREFNKMTERLRRFEALNIEKLLVEKQKSETIVGNISDAIIVCDADARMVLINASAEKFLQIRQAEIVGKHISEVTPDERLHRIFTHPNDFTLLSQPYLQFTVDGVQGYFRPRVSVIPSRHGGRDGVVLILQDVTQFKELDKAKSDFMAMVSHEIRTPVTSINIGVDLLRQHVMGPLTGPQEELLASFKQDCVRLTKLVRNLLQLSKLESGTMVRRDEALDLSRIIDVTLQPLQLQFKEKSVDLCVNIEKALPQLLGDEQHLSWVISNLVSNALRHTPPGGMVEITAVPQGDAILVTVRDTGVGIPKEYHDKIFDKFVQVKGTIDPTPGSVGLGLAIAKDIIEMYGGKIWMESEEQKGSTFFFKLPVVRGRAA